MISEFHKKHIFPLGTLIFFFTFILFIPALQNEFVNWDDNRYIYENQAIKHFNLQFLKYIFFDGGPSNWHPLTMLSHGIDYFIWGEKPFGHHLTSILFHALNTVILFFILIRLFKVTRLKDKTGINDVVASVVISFFFGLHPLRVESVVWISERKDVLCGFFFFLSTLTYLHYVENKEGKQKQLYLLCLIFFTFALLSKPMAVTLPIVFLLLDGYPLGRLNYRKIGHWKKALIEKSPFFSLSLLLTLLTLYKQYEAGSIKMLDHVPLAARIGIAAKAYLICLTKTLLPFNLGPFYPLPFGMSFWSLDYIAPIVWVITLTLITLLLRRKLPSLFTVWLYYLITLLPVVGFISVGGQLFADRYSYIPAIGPAILFSLLILKVLTAIDLKKGRAAVTTLLSLMILLLSLLSIKQTLLWHNSHSLWTRGVKLYPHAGYIAYTQLGLISMHEGNYKNAAREFTKAIIIYEFPFAIYQRGLSNLLEGNYQWAEQDFNWILRNKPLMIKDLRHTARYLRQNKRYMASILAYEKCLTVDPENTEILKALASLYLLRGNKKEAEKYFSRAMHSGEARGVK